MSIAPELVLYNYSLASHTTIATNMTRTFPKKKKKKGLNLQGLDYFFIFFYHKLFSISPNIL